MLLYYRFCPILQKMFVHIVHFFRLSIDYVVKRELVGGLQRINKINPNLLFDKMQTFHCIQK